MPNVAKTSESAPRRTFPLRIEQRWNGLSRTFLISWTRSICTPKKQRR